MSTSNVTPFKSRRPTRPGIENGRVPPARQKNIDRRPREYLLPDEVNQLLKAAKQTGRHGHRDQTLILVAYRHGLRVGEVIALRWDMVDLKQGLIHIRRLKNGVASTHPLRGSELRTLRRLQRDYPASPYLFVTERGGPITGARVRRIVSRAGVQAGIPFPVHPHMLRHACGYKLANDGVDTRALQHSLGHRNIQHTTHYTELSPQRFNKFWAD